MVAVRCVGGCRWYVSLFSGVGPHKKVLSPICLIKSIYKKGQRKEKKMRGELAVRVQVN